VLIRQWVRQSAERTAAMSLREPKLRLVGLVRRSPGSHPGGRVRVRLAPLREGPQMRALRFPQRERTAEIGPWVNFWSIQRADLDWAAACFEPWWLRGTAARVSAAGDTLLGMSGRRRSGQARRHGFCQITAFQNRVKRCSRRLIRGRVLASSGRSVSVSDVAAPKRKREDVPQRDARRRARQRSSSGESFCP
jgi:hypothetical protein